MYQLTKKMVDFRRNQFLNQGLQTEFTIQQENKNKLVSVGSQLKNLNNIEKNRYLKPESSCDESSGESSVMCELNRQKRLSIQDVEAMVIDSDQNQIVKLEPKAFQKNNRVDAEWESQKTIIILDVDEQAVDNLDLEEFFDEYYAGKLSVVIKMKEDKGAQYVFYNLMTSPNKYRRAFGDNIEFAQLKFIEKEQKKNEITVILRYLPTSLTNLDMLTNVKAEQLFTFFGYRYGIFRVSDYEMAEVYKKKLINYFQQGKYNESRITILAKKKQNKEKFKQFLEDDTINPRSQLEQRLGVNLSPKMLPQLVLKEIEPEKIKPQIIQPIQAIQPKICAIPINQEVKQFKQVEIKPAIISGDTKVIARPVQLRPVTFQQDNKDRERSNRKK